MHRVQVQLRREGGLDLHHGALRRHVMVVRRHVLDVEALRAEPVLDRVHISLRGCELALELSGRQVLAVRAAARIAHRARRRFGSRLVAPAQIDPEADAVGRRRRAFQGRGRRPRRNAPCERRPAVCTARRRDGDRDDSSERRENEDRLLHSGPPHLVWARPTGRSPIRQATRAAGRDNVPGCLLLRAPLRSANA